MQTADICIAGAGLIGLSLALELHRRGARVLVLERDRALIHASSAAAGMLAVDDPDNPSVLHPLSRLSRELYPAYLRHIEQLSGLPVPFQTALTFQAIPLHSPTDLTPAGSLPSYLADGARTFAALTESSLDPRQLASALLLAVRSTSIQLLEETALLGAEETTEAVQLQTSAGVLETQCLIYALGAWSSSPVVPRKGQMFSARLPSSFAMEEVVRTEEVYIVPRRHGPRAGTVVVGATIEDAGFDTTTHDDDLDRLRALAGSLIPILGDRSLCPTVDQWAGLRPATPDLLPLLGFLPTKDGPSRRLIASGHYRNGILLAPATAVLLADLVEGSSTSSLDLSAFAPGRFPISSFIAQ